LEAVEIELVDQVFDQQVNVNSNAIKNKLMTKMQTNKNQNDLVDAMSANARAQFFNQKISQEAQ
jgi:hypothetical protein